jgi:hypothetical protein
MAAATFCLTYIEGRLNDHPAGDVQRRFNHKDVTAERLMRAFKVKAVAPSRTFIHPAGKVSTL